MKFSKRLFYEEGMALVTVLSIMMIMFIISLAIVSLSTNNLHTMGNVSARFQALNLANAAIMYGMYDLNSYAPQSPYNACDPPSSPTGGVTTYSFNIDDNAKGGTCRLVFYNNLFNPNKYTGLDFGSDYGGAFTVPGNTAVLVGEGIYNGFKRKIRVVIKNNESASAGLCADKDISICGSDPNSPLLLNGIEDLATMKPRAGYIHSNSTGTALTFGGSKNTFKSLNGSRFSCPTGASPVIDPNLANYVETRPKINIANWEMIKVAGDPSLYISQFNTAPGSLSGSPPTANDSLTNAIYGVEADSSYASITIPDSADVPVPVTGLNDSNKRYVAGNKTADLVLTVNQDTCINGNLAVYGKIQITNNAKLFVNGTLETGGIVSGSQGTIIVSGYKTGGTEDRSSLKINDQVELQVDRDNSLGTCIYTHGDLSINAGTITPDSDVDQWLFKDSPQKTSAVQDTFKKLGLENISGDTDAQSWYTSCWSPSSTVSKCSCGSSHTGKDILSGNCPQYSKDTVIPKEVYNWFALDTSGKNLMINGIFNKNRWDTFKSNPSVFSNSADVYLQGVVYTHGNVHIKGRVHVIGAVVAKEDTVKSPGSLGGTINLENGGNIITDAEYLKSGLMLFRNLTTIISWQEI